MACESSGRHGNCWPTPYPRWRVRHDNRNAMRSSKLRDCSAEATLEAFTRKFRHVPPCVRRTLTYDQGKEMARHKLLAKRVKINVYFADPHSPWQRSTNENTNGLIREYPPRAWIWRRSLMVTSTRLHDN